MILAHKLGDLFRNDFALALHDFRPHALREADIVSQRSLVLIALVRASIHVECIQIAIHGLGHARAPRDQILSRRIRAKAYRNPLPHLQQLAIFILEFRKRAVDRLRHLPQGQLAQRHQVCTAEEICQRALYSL